MTTYLINPTVPRGYALNGCRGAFGIIRPEATTNLCRNPSAELGLTGYSSSGANATRITTWQRRGAYGIQVTPTSSTGTRALLYDESGLTNGQPLTISFDFRGVGGLTYEVSATNTGGASWRFVASGQDERVAFTAQALTATSTTVQIDMISPGAQPFYIDGLQLEHKTYATTYCDGDLAGFIPTQVDFAWTGLRHASPSTRSAQTRAGGRIIMLDTIGLSIISVIGLALAPLGVIGTPLATGGGVHQTTLLRERPFSLVGDIYADTTLQLLQQRDDLADLLSPFIVATPQPLVLRHQAFDASGRQAITETTDIVAHYEGGFEGAWDNNHQERLALQFRMFFPTILKDGDSGGELSERLILADGEGIAQRTPDGTWTALGTGGFGVNAIVSRPAGGLYVGGSFVNMGGAANADGIAQWNGTAWSALGTGAAGGDVLALALLANGDLIAGGTFTSMGGVANTARIARWNDSSGWTSIATNGANGAVNALVVGRDGVLYVGGDFTQVNATAYTRLAQWNGTTWSALGTGANAVVRALAIATDGDLLVGGDFTNVNGQAIDRAARRDLAASTWDMIGSGFDADVYALLQAPNGLIYAAGDFTASGTVGTTYVAQFGGTAWANLTTGTGSPARSLAYDPRRQLLYVGGQDGGGLVSDAYSVWNGSGWLPSEVGTSATATNAIHISATGALTIGGDWVAGLSFATAATTTIANSGSADAYPTVVYTNVVANQSLLSLINYTTGGALYFDTELGAGEVITVAFAPDGLTITSSLRGSILGDILPGSNIIAWRLVPGDNTISLFATSSAGSAVIWWQDAYLSLDQTVIRE